MATKSIAWNTGSGNINVEYGGSKDGTIVVTSDNNNLYESRSQQIKVRTTDGSNIERTITIQQAAKVRTNISSAIVTAPTQTYSGSAKTPTVTVTLNGVTIPSSGYDVAYSDNTNAGTATITVTGKNDYTGTANGSFTIAQREVTLSWGTLTWTYDGSTHSTTCTAGNVISGDTCNVTLTGNSITNAGSTTVTASSLSNDNYALPSTTTNTITISAKVVTLNWGTTSWTYDKASHSTTCTASGLVGSDTCAVTLTNNSIGANVGSTTVTASALSNNNYALPSSNTKTISIVAKTISLTWGTITWVYDASAHGTTCTASGVLSGDTCTITLSGNSITNKGTTTVTASSLSNSNYALPSSKTNTLTISARPINITAGSTSKTYDGSALTYNSATAESTGTNRGLVSGHSMTSYTVTGTITNAGSTNNVPSAAIIKSGSTDVTSNYSITYVNGTLTIAKASRTISFADSYVVLNTSSNTTKTATPSAGSGDGSITYSISSTTYATINSSSGKVKSKTSDGSATVTATIAEGTNYLSASASYTLYVFATTHDYSYNGSYRSVTLPPGTYQFQVWGAQGGSNGTNSSYGITAQAGGKGGYSVGQLTVSQATGVMVYVGGAGSSTSGGYNGGGDTTGTSQYDANGEFGYSKMGGGGGATDIRLSDGSLYSRMIVAGGGSGGAMNYRAVTTTVTSWEQVTSGTLSPNTSSPTEGEAYMCLDWISALTEGTYKLELARTPDAANKRMGSEGYNVGTWKWIHYTANTTTYTFTVSSSEASSITRCDVFGQYIYHSSYTYGYTLYKQVSSSSTITSNNSHVGYAGGGVNGDGYSSSFYGKQNGAGSGGSFGQGFSVSTTTSRYATASGGGGWYGGGSFGSDDVHYENVIWHGGGSGWVNTSASAANRPSGFSSLQLDSGTTYAGNTSFPSTSGGTETGHSGNGYARITRL